MVPLACQRCHDVIVLRIQSIHSHGIYCMTCAKNCQYAGAIRQQLVLRWMGMLTDTSIHVKRAPAIDSIVWFHVSLFLISMTSLSIEQSELLLMRTSCISHLRCFCERFSFWFICLGDVRVEQEPRAGSGEPLMKVKSGRSPWAAFHVTCFTSCSSTHWKWNINGLHLRITGSFV